MSRNESERARLIAALATLEDLRYTTPVWTHGKILEDATRLVALRLADVSAGVEARDADQAERFYRARTGSTTADSRPGARMAVAAEQEAAKS